MDKEGLKALVLVCGIAAGIVAAVTLTIKLLPVIGGKMQRYSAPRQLGHGYVPKAHKTPGFQARVREDRKRRPALNCSW